MINSSLIARIKMMKLKPLDLSKHHFPIKRHHQKQSSTTGSSKVEVSTSWRGKDGEILPSSLAMLSGSSLWTVISAFFKR